MFSIVALMAEIVSSDVEQRLSRMTALYEQACIKAFPDERAVEAVMTAHNAKPLTPDDVKLTLRDDPGRGWEIHDGNVTALIFLEDPPYHTCSVRWPVPQNIGDLGEYRAIANSYERATGSFSPINPYNVDYGDIHVHAVGEQRTLPDGSLDSLFVYDQHITDPNRRAAGETGVMLRFVHQFAAPGEK